MGGIVPTQAEAEELIAAAGGTPLRAQNPTGYETVSTHTYPHINYETAGGQKATVRVTNVENEYGGKNFGRP